MTRRYTMWPLALLVGATALFGLPANRAQAQEGPPIDVEGETGRKKELALEVGQNRLLKVNVPIARVSVAEPNVADVAVYTNTQLLITAKGVGETFLTVWDRSERSLTLSVHVERNLEGLRKQLEKLFPGEAIQVMAAGDLVVLSGELSDVRLPERIIDVAKLHAPRIANLLRVRGNHQVQVEVKFAEVSRGGLREMGVHWFHQSSERVAGISTPSAQAGNFQNRLPTVVPGTDLPGIPPVQAAPFSNAFSMFFSGVQQFPFSVMVSLLEGQNLAKTLAEPTLVAMTGQEARFLAGGEFPVPINTGFGAVNVDYKKFGIQLKFLPTVMNDGLVTLRLNAEVSDIDPSIGVVLGGYSVPGLTTRQSETTVRLRDGQSFAIAGLLSDRVRSTVNKIPVLGDIPILGSLFRSTAYRREESELLVIVTVRLVKPLGQNELPPMPGSFESNDPNDFELFLLGRDTNLLKKEKLPEPGEAIPVRIEGGPAGPHGYQRDR